MITLTLTVWLLSGHPQVFIKVTPNVGSCCSEAIALLNNLKIRNINSFQINCEQVDG